ncbi:hypothetical protein PMI36_05628 [Pseudomonas sp. GM79]|nr:hypothetical protein PMI36_05628 [Pseudomonas sp. GM79]
MDGEWSALSACSLNEDSDAEWNGTSDREKVTCKRCLAQMAKPPKPSTFGIPKERPILFNGPMVSGILSGNKTVTRRLVGEKQIPRRTDAGHYTAEAQPGRYGFNVSGSTEHACAEELALYGLCPFGKRGDRLWVRETFALLGNEDGVCVDWNDNLQKGDEQSAAKIYRASCTQGDYGLWEVPDTAAWKPKTDGLLHEGAWRPSIHMPRWASRILLEITDVRVERLWDIDDKQSLAEGIYSNPEVNDMYTADGDHHTSKRGGARSAFIHLWESTGGDWNGNPWVWAISFKKVAP